MELILPNRGKSALCEGRFSPDGLTLGMPVSSEPFVWEISSNADRRRHGRLVIRNNGRVKSRLLL